jgi:hypothetical protein
MTLGFLRETKKLERWIKDGFVVESRPCAFLVAYKLGAGRTAPLSTHYVTVSALAI